MNTMTTITIPRALLEQALEALEIVTDDYDDSAVGLEIDAIQALRAELAKPPTAPAWHDAPEVAIPYKYNVVQNQNTGEEQKMPRDSLHGVAQYLYQLLDDIDTASDIAKNDDRLYRGIVERTQAKKSDVVEVCDGYRVVFKPLPNTPTPAWHDAPEVATLKAERDEAMKDAERYRWLAAHTRRTSEHWGWRWSIVIDGPVPKRNDCEDAFNEAIDAAIAKTEWRTE